MNFFLITSVIYFFGAHLQYLYLYIWSLCLYLSHFQVGIYNVILFIWIEFNLSAGIVEEETSSLAYAYVCCYAINKLTTLTTAWISVFKLLVRNEFLWFAIFQLHFGWPNTTIFVWKIYSIQKLYQIVTTYFFWIYITSISFWQRG